MYSAGAKALDNIMRCLKDSECRINKIKGQI